MYFMTNSTDTCPLRDCHIPKLEDIQDLSSSSSIFNQSTWLGYGITCLAAAGLGYSAGYLTNTILNPETSLLKKKIALVAHAVVMPMTGLFIQALDLSPTNSFMGGFKKTFGVAFAATFGFRLALENHKIKNCATLLLPATKTTDDGQETPVTHLVAVKTLPLSVAQDNDGPINDYVNTVNEAREKLDQRIQENQETA